MDGLALLGADSTSLADQYIVLRILRIDKDRFKEKAGGLAAAALPLLDTAPKAALDVVRPFIETAASNYGIGAEVTVSNVPPSQGGRAISEFWPGLFVGGALGASVLVIGKLAGKLMARFRK
jgi:hypothetical protein